MLSIPQFAFAILCGAVLESFAVPRVDLRSGPLLTFPRECIDMQGFPKIFPVSRVLMLAIPRPRPPRATDAVLAPPEIFAVIAGRVLVLSHSVL